MTGTRDVAYKNEGDEINQQPQSTELPPVTFSKVVADISRIFETGSQENGMQKLLSKGILPDVHISNQEKAPSGTDGASQVSPENNSERQSPPVPAEQQPARNASREEIAQLISKLGDQSFSVRNKASAELSEIGAAALPQLKEALKSPDIEIKQRAERIIEQRLQSFKDFAAASDWGHSCTSPDFEKFAKQMDLLAKMSPDAQTRVNELDFHLDLLRNNDRMDGREKKELIEDLEKAKKLLADPERMSKKASEVTELGVKPGTQLSDAQLANLKYFPNLESLNLCGAKITDGSLEQLKNCPKLTKVQLSDTDVTDKGLTKLKDFQSLRNVDLSRTLVTDAGLSTLKDMASLEELKLDGTKITSNGLKQIAAMPNLTSLSLKGTDFKPDDLKQLKGMTNLQKLDIDENRIRASEIERLRDALPDCEINGNTKNGKYG